MNNTILDYLDFKRINILLDGFNKSTGFVTAILDLEGNVLSQSGWRKICTKFHRVNPESNSNCLISDTILANMSTNDDFNIYKCHNGLYDVAVPLVIDGIHAANIFTGQFLMETPKTEFFEDQAKKYGFEIEDYIKALKDVPIVNENQVRNVVEFLLDITHMIIDLTKEKIEQENLKTLLESSLESPKDIIILSLDKNYRYLYFNSSHKKIMLQAYNTVIKEGDCIFDFMTSDEDIKRIKYNYDIALSGVSHATVEKYGDFEENYFETRFNPILNKNNEIIGLTVYAENRTEMTKAYKKQKESEEKYKLLMDMMSLGMVHYQVTFDEINMKNRYQFLEVNKKFEEQVGIKKSDLFGKFLIDVFPKTEQYWLDNFDKVVSSGKSVEFQDYSVEVDGYMKLSIYLIKYNILAVVIEDVTLIENEKEIAKIYLDNLLLARNMFENSIENAPTPIMIHAEDGTVLNISKTWTKLTGYQKHEIPTIYDWTEKAYGQNKEEVIDFIRGLYHLDNIQHDGEFVITTKDGKKLTWDFNSGYIGNLPDGSAVAMSVAMDVTERLEREQEINYLSYHDPLTSLYNRRFFEEQIKRLDNPRNLPLSIIMGDVNGLKLINDAFGHNIGDQLLKLIGNIISNSIRGNDIAARWGGDEFTILMPRSDMDAAEVLINRIQQKIKESTFDYGTLSISFGVETKRNKEEDINDLFMSAEALMYQNKLVEIDSIRGETINTIMNTLFEKSADVKEHSIRVSEIAISIAENMNLSKASINDIKTIGMIHDIGKIAIDLHILDKPDKLTDDEKKIIQQHPLSGSRMLNSSHEYSRLAVGVLHHHERIDGKGYPNGITGDQIPIESKIIAVADAFDAMTAQRPYRLTTLSVEDAMAELQKHSGTQFDSEIVKVFVENYVQVTKK